MPPRASKPAKAKQKPQEDQREESLQAVVSMSRLSETIVLTHFIGSCRFIRDEIQTFYPGTSKSDSHLNMYTSASFH